MVTKQQTRRGKPGSGAQVSASATSPVIRVRRGIRELTRLLLVVRAGGRCEFDDHNEYLLQHPLTLTPGNFAQMAHNGVGLIWSPRSNISLYGVTANVAAAKAAEVTMAIAPDWSPSGSNGMSEELRYAYEWNQRQHEPVFSPAEMVAMATSKPAQLAGVSDKAGALAAGYAADLVIYPRKGDSPLMALLDADPGNVELVVVGGKPMLGEPGIMKKLVRDAPLETLRVCNFTKSLNTRDDMGGESWDEVVTHLTEELKRFKLPLAELADCGDAHSPPETGPAQR